MEWWNIEMMGKRQRGSDRLAWPQIIERVNGDIAVDDRDNKVALHRSDYLLHDLSPGWRELAANVPVYATWDDHDYFNKKGIPTGFTEANLAAVRTVWRQSRNNPSCGFEDRADGIFFRMRIGS